MKDTFSRTPVRTEKFRFEMEAEEREDAAEKTEDTKTDDERKKVRTEDSTRERLVLFAEETTVHGVKYTVDKEHRNRFARALWSLMGLVCVGALLKVLISLFMSYSLYPVKTVVKVTPTEQLPFPAVTICNLNGLEISKLQGLDDDQNNVTGAIIALSLVTSIMQDHINETIPAIKSQFSQEVLNMTYQDLSRQAFADLNTTFMNCFWDNREEDCGAMFTPVDMELRRCFQFNAQWPPTQRRVSTHSGRTSGLHVVANIKQEDYVFDDTLAAGLKILLHEPGEMPDIDSRGFLVSPGFSVMVKTSARKFHYLPAPFKAFGDTACVPEVPLSPAMSQSTNYTYTTALCHKVCLDLKAQEVCHCRVADVSFTLNRSMPLCTVDQVFTCFKLQSVSFQDELQSSGCLCPRPCDRIEYCESTSFAYFPSDITLSAMESFQGLDKEYTRKNFVDLSIFFDDLSYSEIEHEAEYTIDSIFGTIGGQMGLFMGASLLSIAELLELLCGVCYRVMRWLLCRRLHLVKPGNAEL